MSATYSETFQKKMRYSYIFIYISVYIHSHTHKETERERESNGGKKLGNLGCDMWDSFAQILQI